MMSRSGSLFGDFKAGEEVPRGRVHIHQGMGAVVQHLIVSTPAVLQTHIQILSLPHQSSSFFQGAQTLAVKSNHCAFPQQWLSLENNFAEIVVAQKHQIVETYLLICQNFLPRRKCSLFLRFLRQIELLYNRIILDSLLLFGLMSHCDFLRPSEKGSSKEYALGLFGQQHSLEGCGIKQQQSQHFPTYGPNCTVFLREVVVMKCVEGDWLRVYAKDVLAFLLPQILLLGIFSPLIELLVVLHQPANDFAWLQLFFHSLYVLYLQFLCLLDLKNLFVVVCHLLSLFLLGLPKVPSNRNQVLIGDFERSEVGMLGDEVELDGCLAPIELSEQGKGYLVSAIRTSRCSCLLSSSRMYLSLGTASTSIDINMPIYNTLRQPDVGTQIDIQIQQQPRFVSLTAPSYTTTLSVSTSSADGGVPSTSRLTTSANSLLTPAPVLADTSQYIMSSLLASCSACSRRGLGPSSRSDLLPTRHVQALAP